MAYCTTDDVIGRLSEQGVTHLVDDDRDGVINTEETANITAAIRWADDRIDMFCYGKYAVPFASGASGATSTQVKSLSIDLACGFLSMRMGWSNVVLESLMSTAIETLGEIKKRRIFLASVNPSSNPYPAAANIVSEPFTTEPYSTEYTGNVKIERVDK